MQYPRPKFSVSFGLIIGLMFAATVPAPASDKEFAAVKEAFAKRDLIAIQRLDDYDYQKLILPLNQDQLNQVALLAGKNLEMHPRLKGVKYKEIATFLNKPENDQVREQWGLNWASIELIRKLGEERRINDEAVLPHLIQALQHTDSSFKRYAYYCLRDLTFRDIGGEIWGRAIDDPKKEPALRQWWEKWWQANKGKQLIIEADFQNKLKKQVMDTLHLIFDRLEKKHPEIMKTHMPRSLHPGGRELPFVEYTPRRMAFIHPPAVKFQDLPSLRVEANFLTTGPDTKPAKAFPRGTYKVIHQKVFPNTDVALRVLLDSPNLQLEQDMIQLLQKDLK